MSRRRQRQGVDLATHLRESDAAPERIASAWWQGWQPTDAAQRMVYTRIPADGSALLYEVIVEVPGLTGQRARAALFALAMGGKVRAWEEAPGIHLVARGPFRQCDRCGAQCAPGPCWACKTEPKAVAAMRAEPTIGGACSPSKWTAT